MANKLKLLVDFIAYTTSQPTNDPANDSTKIKSSVEESTFTELCRKQISIADAVVDQSITLADTNSEYLILFTDQTVTIKLNGSADAITVNPKSAGTKTLGLMLKGSITGLTVSNASGSAANLDVISVNL